MLVVANTLIESCVPQRLNKIEIYRIGRRVMDMTAQGPLLAVREIYIVLIHLFLVD